MKFDNQSSDLSALFKTIGQISQETGLPVYAVGGFVRDAILDRPSQDIDFVVEGDGPALAERVCKKLNGHGWAVYRKFGTASFHQKHFKLEFVTARRESYRDDSRKPDVEACTLQEDLTRRDFTVNALAVSLNPSDYGTIIDPFNGLQDIEKGILKTPLAPGQTFSEDPLRIMRAARFASQLQFKIDPTTWEAMRTERQRLKIVSQERITDEFLKILSHPVPSVGLRILQETGVLEIVFPELSVLSGVEQRDDYHHKDVFEHTLKVLDNVAQVTADLKLRFTALIHDIGKPRVKRFVKGTGWTFHGHELAGTRMLKSIARRLRLPNDYLQFSTKLTRLHMRPIQLTSEEVTDSAVRRLLFEAGDDIESLMMLCRADITSGNPARVKKHLANFDFVASRMEEVEEKDRMRAFQSPVRGDEIMAVCGLEPGPAVGVIKKKIEEAILDGVIPNEYEAAKAYLMEIKKTL